MFKTKPERPQVQVIKVRNETRDVVDEETQSYMYAGGRSTKTKTTKKCGFTIVLLAKDGELCTKEFNGKWDLSDIKNWEDL